MGKKAFLPTSRPRRALPARVLQAAGLAVAARAGRDVDAAPLVPRRPSRPSLSGGPPWPVVLGIDPGTIVVGYGAIEVGALGPRLLECGVVRPRRRASPPERLGEIQTALILLLQKLRPGVVVVEQAFAARNARSALRIGEGRGVALACAAAFGAEVVEIAPAAAKKALVGHGAADKTQVAAMTAVALGLREAPRPLDASDALALALTHVWFRVDWLRDGRRQAAGGAGSPARSPRGRAAAAPA